MKQIKNKVVFITGASSGIGAACAHIFAQNGARLILTARRQERLEALAKHLEDKYQAQSLIMQLDVTDNQQVQKKISNLSAPWQKIDILINNAGLALDTLPIQDGIVAHWDTMIDTNVKGLLYLSRAILPGMIEQGEGQVINIGSVAGHDCYPNGNVYSATKWAVHGISESMRLDLLGKNIRVTEIAPGAVETEFSEVRWNDKQKAKEFYTDFTPLTAEDIAETVLFAADRPAHVNIAQILVLPTDQASANYIHRES